MSEAGDAAGYSWTKRDGKYRFRVDLRAVEDPKVMDELERESETNTEAEAAAMMEQLRAATPEARTDGDEDRL